MGDQDKFLASWPRFVENFVLIIMQQTASKSDHLGPSYGPKTDRRSKKSLQSADFELDFLVEI